MKLSNLSTQQSNVSGKWLSVALVALIATVASDLQASDMSKKIGSINADCPCAYDEPFVSVLHQIDNHDAWNLGQTDQQFVELNGAWQNYQLFYQGQKRHTLQLKLAKSPNSAHLFCSWIQWSEDGTINNKIGMGHHLFKDLVDAGRAKKACLTQISKRLRRMATPVESRIVYPGPMSSLR